MIQEQSFLKFNPVNLPGLNIQQLDTKIHKENNKKGHNNLYVHDWIRQASLPNTAASMGRIFYSVD